MKQIRSILFALCAMAIWGCSQDVGGAGGSLRYVDAQGMRGQELYYLPSVSDLPLTQAQVASLGDEGLQAIAVRVEIYDDVAVAWRALNGEAQFGQTNIVALWEVVDAHPISDDNRVAPGGTWSPTDPGFYVGHPGITTNPVSTSVPRVTTNPNLVSGADVVMIDFLNRFGGTDPNDALLIQRLNRAHPGCL